MKNSNLTLHAPLFSTDNKFVYVATENEVHVYPIDKISSGTVQPVPKRPDPSVTISIGHDIIAWMAVYPYFPLLIIGNVSGQISLWDTNGEMQVSNETGLEFVKNFSVLFIGDLMTFVASESATRQILVQIPFSLIGSHSTFRLSEMYSKMVVVSGFFVAIPNTRKSVFIIHENNEQLVYDHTVPITAISVYDSADTDILVAIGDEKGAIYFLRIFHTDGGIFESSILPMNLHWHSTPVRSLVFHPQTKVLYSGADEAVLCIWTAGQQPSQIKRTGISDPRSSRPLPLTLPGLGSSIIHLVIQNDLLAVTTSDNTIRYLPVQSLRTPSCLILGIKAISLCIRSIFVCAVPLLGYLLPAAPGTLQLIDDCARVVEEWVVTPQNIIDRDQSEYFNVTFVCVSDSFVVTAEERHGNFPYGFFECNFKVWSIADGRPVLLSCVSNPHSKKITSLVFVSCEDLLFATCSEDGLFKLWKIDNYVVSLFSEASYLKGWIPMDIASINSLIAIPFVCPETKSIHITIWEFSSSSLKMKQTIDVQYEIEDISDICRILFFPSENSDPSFLLVVSGTKSLVCAYEIMIPTCLWSYSTTKDLSFTCLGLGCDNDVLVGYSACFDGASKFGIMGWKAGNKIPFQIDTLEEAPVSISCRKEQIVSISKTGHLFFSGSKMDKQKDGYAHQLPWMPVSLPRTMSRSKNSDRGLFGSDLVSTSRLSLAHLSFLVSQVEDLPSHALPGPAMLFDLCIFMK